MRWGGRGRSGEAHAIEGLRKREGGSLKASPTTLQVAFANAVDASGCPFWRVYVRANEGSAMGYEMHPVQYHIARVLTIDKTRHGR